MKTVVHISADFPDALVPGKTRAVENLVNATEGFRHVVYSLNRVNGWSDIATVPFGEDRLAIAYPAPPFGIGLERFLSPVAELISRDLERRGISPGLIHAHKFSVEGLIASEVAREVQVPFVASLWGDTDIKIVEAKRNMRERYKAVARQAALLLPPAPWTQRYFRKALNLPDRHFHPLPVMTAGDAVLKPVLTHPPRLVSVFALDSWKRKGLDILVKAVARVAVKRPDVVLDIYGRGSPKSLIEVTRIIRNSEAADRIRLKGPLAHDQIQRRMNGYTAFVMAPRRETYGMVHVEAVLAGVPILWSQDRGVDGLFEGLEVGRLCDPNSVESVADNILVLLSHERKLKENILDLQREDVFEQLRRAGIAANYRRVLTRLTESLGDTLKPIVLAGSR